MNLNRKRAPSGRKDFLEKNSRFFTGHALPEKMPAVSSDTERKIPADLPGVFRKVRPISGPRCMKCGRPVKMEEEYCEDCRKGAHHFTEGRSIFWYGEVWRQSLVRFKYYGCREYGDFYAKAMSVFGKKYLERWKPDLIVPVPLHPRKKRMRGFNQAAYLAERLSVLTGIPWNGHLVKKIRSTRSQKKLNAIQRRQNLKNAYQVTERIPGFSVLVVDDVYTTGSTADAMAMCLLEAGAEKVYFLTICAGRA